MIPRLWARARYDFGLTSTEFYALTPRQFYFLARAHREQLAHEEMVAAYTTAEVINNGLYRPKKLASPLDFMPNHRDHQARNAPLTDEQLAAESEHNCAVLRVKLQMIKDAQNA